MANNNFQSYAPESVGVSVEVADHLIGRSVIDGLRRSFTVEGQEQQGDELMKQSYELSEKHLELMEHRSRIIIEESYERFV